MKYILFANLYFIQGIILTIGWLILPLYFVEKDIPLPIATMVIGVIMIPWSIKFFWGGIVDYFIRFGRKTFIILGGILFAFGLFAVAFIDPGVSLVPFAFFLFLSVSGVVFLDVAVDAWAIETSHKDDRGKIGGTMFAGQYVGMASSSVLLTYVAQNIGYNYVFILAGIIILITLFFPLLIKESKIAKRPEKMRNLLIGEFKKKTTQIISVFSPIIFISSGLLRLVIPLYMKINLNLEDAQIGLIIAIILLMTALGSIIVGPISDRIGKKKVLYAIIGASITFTASLIIANNWMILAVLYGIIEFLRGGYTSVVVAMYMDVCNPRVGATQFSILTSLANAGTTAGNTVSGSLVTLLGFSRVFLYSAWFFGPALILLYLIRFKNIVRKKQINSTK